MVLKTNPKQTKTLTGRVKVAVPFQRRGAEGGRRRWEGDSGKLAADREERHCLTLLLVGDPTADQGEDGG